MVWDGDGGNALVWLGSDMAPAQKVEIAATRPILRARRQTMTSRGARHIGWKVAALLTICPACELTGELHSPPEVVKGPSVVIQPSAPEFQHLSLTIDGERSVGAIARALGATVDDLLLDNDLRASDTLKDGQELAIRTRPNLLRDYVERRTEAKRRKAELLAEREAAAKAEALAKAAEAAAKRRADRQAKREQRRQRRKK